MCLNLCSRQSNPRRAVSFLCSTALNIKSLVSLYSSFPEKSCSPFVRFSFVNSSSFSGMQHIRPPRRFHGTQRLQSLNHCLHAESTAKPSPSFSLFSSRNPGASRSSRCPSGKRIILDFPSVFRISYQTESCKPKRNNGGNHLAPITLYPLFPSAALLILLPASARAGIVGIYLGLHTLHGALL